MSDPPLTPASVQDRIALHAAGVASVTATYRGLGLGLGPTHGDPLAPPVGRWPSVTVEPTQWRQGIALRCGVCTREAHLSDTLFTRPTEGTMLDLPAFLTTVAKGWWVFGSLNTGVFLTEALNLTVCSRACLHKYFNDMDRSYRGEGDKP